MTPSSTRRRPLGPAGSTRRSAGFTLIELMIAVAIVGILASIAYPSYTRYVTESRRAEAKVILMEVAAQLERCYTVNNSYEDCNAFPRDSENGFYFVEEPDGWDGTGSEPSAGFIAAFAYRIVAEAREPQKSRDSDCGDLTLNHRGERGATGQRDDCW
ncbi:type IV pilin protein [Halomonas sp. BM-2019]|uniref:type IV pilin protein n=1 Tax=Halomonas sp. BM-2019 TaxID=2811227 RepID=UPI0031FD6278